MSKQDLTPGQRNLLATLERLRDVDLGDAEPASVFHPTTWAAAAPVTFDLDALATGWCAEPGDTPEPAATIDVATDLPPACAGVREVIAAVTSGETTAAAVVEAAQSRIEACNPALNAFITHCPDRGREEAAVVDEVVAAEERPRPLSGVPLAHKDIIATRDIRTTAGSSLLRDHVPGEDATVVGRLSNAGACLLGKTNTHEFATGTTGAVSYFGAVRNPWNLDHISGGSSSGSGAALAAGMVSAASGTDTGGSIRIPAACCGVVGLKPTYGRVSRSGVMPFAWGLDHVGPMARSVRDTAILLTAMAGPDPYDRASSGEPGMDFAAGIDQGAAGLRFCLPAEAFLEQATAPVAAAVSEAAEVLAGLGAQRVEVDMPAELDLVGPAAVALFLAEGGTVHRRTLAQHPDAYCAATRAFLALAENVQATDYLLAQQVRARLCDAMARVFQSVDVLLLPTLPMVAPPIEAREVEGPGGAMDVRAALTTFTRPFNLTGLPALSMPCGFHDDLPIGLQVVGRPFDEATVLRAAFAYEEATDWNQRRPPLFP